MSRRPFHVALKSVKWLKVLHLWYTDKTVISQDCTLCFSGRKRVQKEGIWQLHSSLLSDVHVYLTTPHSNKYVINIERITIWPHNYLHLLCLRPVSHKYLLWSLMTWSQMMMRLLSRRMRHYVTYMNQSFSILKTEAVGCSATLCSCISNCTASNRGSHDPHIQRLLLQPQQVMCRGTAVLSLLLFLMTGQP